MLGPLEVSQGDGPLPREVRSTPTICATSTKVERTGIEPVTSDLQIPGSTVRLSQIRSIRGLLLFDRYTIESVRLTELPGLIDAFGSTGLTRLLESGAVAVALKPFTIAQTGQTTALESRERKGALPLLGGSRRTRGSASLVGLITDE